jgi:hypothetical protein
MRSRRLLGALAVVLPAIAVGAWALLPRSSRSLVRGIYQIKAGMSRSEVEIVLGPPGDYRSGPVNYGSPMPFAVPGSTNSAADFWANDTGYAFVFFDESGQVTRFGAYLGVRESQDVFDNLLWRLNRQWGKWFP